MREKEVEGRRERERKKNEKMLKMLTGEGTIAAGVTAVTAMGP